MLQLFSRILLILVYYNDQPLRIWLGKADNRYLKGMLCCLITIQDMVNKAIVSMILPRIGWPSKKVYGVKAYLGAFYAVQHSDKETMLKYIRAISGFTHTGEADGIHYAMMIDRILMYRKKRQIYGTQLYRRDTDGIKKTFVYPLIDIEKVDIRRIKAGFDTTLNEYALKNDAIIQECP